MKLPSHLRTILSEIFHHSSEKTALIVYDESTPLAKLLAAAYLEILPQAQALNFDQTEVPVILKALESLSAGDLVVLVQSTRFRLNEFRLRVVLFNQGIKVIEHPHLGRVLESEFPTYINSLAYDRDYYHHIGPALKKRLDGAEEVRLISGANTLIYGGKMEKAKLNIGDYSQLKNIGGQFPIGEVFTELCDLTLLNGKISLFSFGDQSFSVFNCPEPIVITIQKGQLVEATPPLPAFEAVLQDIRQHEGDIWVRELGFGLNRAMTRTIQIRHDVGIYERMCGIHLSLGGKHTVYPKEGFPKKKMKYHVDIFAAVDTAFVSGEIVFDLGKYII